MSKINKDKYFALQNFYKKNIKNDPGTYGKKLYEKIMS